MLNNIALDVFIGLTFIYLLYSLLATILQEMLARWFNLRSRMLQKGIRRMLEDDNKYSDFTLLNAGVEIWFGVVRFFNPDYRSTSKFTKAFFKYPTIKYLAESGWNSKPAYINANDFSTTLIHLLLGDHFDDTAPRINLIRERLFLTRKFQLPNNPLVEIDADTLSHLQKLFLDANNDVDRFETLLENWFTNTMDRVNGWYKSQSRLMLFLIGLFLAYNFNIDSIAIYNLLAKDKTARESLVQLAIASKPKYEELQKQLGTNSQVSSTIKKANPLDRNSKDTVFVTKISVLSDSSLDSARATIMKDIDKASSIAALGWPDKDSCRACDLLNKTLASTKGKDSVLTKKLKDEINRYNTTFNCSGNPYQKKSTRTIGWILTASAISLGATFWFDLLNKLISIRNSGKTPIDTNNPTTNTPAGTNTGASPIKRIG